MPMAETKPHSPQQIAKRRDDAVRRALNTPPKPLKEMKKGKGRKKQQGDSPSASGDGMRT